MHAGPLLYPYVRGSGMLSNSHCPFLKESEVLPSMTPSVSHSTPCLITSIHSLYNSNQDVTITIGAGTSSTAALLRAYFTLTIEHDV